MTITNKTKLKNLKKTLKINQKNFNKFDKLFFRKKINETIKQLKKETQ